MRVRRQYLRCETEAAFKALVGQRHTVVYASSTAAAAHGIAITIYFVQ
jgi:hypothetical protein